MADWPADVACLADALGVERFVVAGHSSGGPYALACAALLGDRVAACITLGGVTDMAWPPAWEGYPPFELEMIRAPDEAAAMARCEALFGADGSGFLSASGLAFSAPDERLYTNAAIAPLLTASRVEAFRQGVVGYAQDLAIQGRPWPFHPEEIGCPVHILHGDGDTLLPLAHSVHNAELIPRGRLHLATGHGHFTILEELPALVTRNSSPGDGPVSA
jgi:pimeloyl-ACP methyl ester carboxylesterase